MTIFCTGCQSDVVARLTNGREQYAHRPDLYDLKFWKCDTCKAFVGCHRGTEKPLGFLATPEVKRERRKIHALLDPLWQSGKIARGKAYAFISERIGKTYHTAEIYSVEDGKRIYEVVRELEAQLKPQPRLSSGDAVAQSVIKSIELMARYRQHEAKRATRRAQS